MLLNDGKFEAIRYGLDELLKALTYYTAPSGKKIKLKKTIQDLGVLLSDDCTFKDLKDQINSIIEKARNMVSWILRPFKTRSPMPMLAKHSD